MTFEAFVAPVLGFGRLSLLVMPLARLLLRLTGFRLPIDGCRREIANAQAIRDAMTPGERRCADLRLSPKRRAEVAARASVGLADLEGLLAQDAEARRLSR